jgi:AraC-like DNA-binding protein
VKTDSLIRTGDEGDAFVVHVFELALAAVRGLEGPDISARTVVVVEGRSPRRHNAIVRWLSRFIDDIGVIELPTGHARPVTRLPDGRTSLVVRTLDSGEGDLWVFGPRTRAHFKNATGFRRAVMIHFKPGWSAQLLGIAADTLTDRMVPLADVWGHDADELCDSLAAAPRVVDVLDRLSDTIARRTSQTCEPASAHLARRAVRLFEREELRVEAVAKQLGVTARHLRRAFAESIGVAPKEFARSVRLRRAIKQTAGSNDWGQIASDVGYYDQAHLIADFRDLVGLTPRAYLAHVRGRY